MEMLASRRELDMIGGDFHTSELRLPAYLFGVYSGHCSLEVKLCTLETLGPNLGYVVGKVEVANGHTIWWCVCCTVESLNGLQFDEAATPSQGDETMGCGTVMLHVVVVMILLCV